MSFALSELRRCAKLHAFNVLHYRVKTKINQHLTIYEFCDRSKLKIYVTKKSGVVIDSTGKHQSTLMINR